MGFITQYIIFDNIMESQVKEQFVIDGNIDGTNLNQFTDQWLNNKYTKFMKYYIYNYTNPIEILTRGSLPDVTEKGPYSYKETWLHYNLSFSNDKNYFTFSRKKIYTFDPVTSCDTCKEDDIFLVPDLIFIKLMDQLTSLECQNLPKQIQSLLCNDTKALPNFDQIMNQIMNLLGTGMKAWNVGPFVQVKVNDLLFNGYKDPIFTKMLTNILDIVYGIVGKPKNGTTTFDFPTVALNQNNNTMGLVYTVKTGKFNYSEVGQTYSFTNQFRNFSSSGSYLPNGWWPGNDALKQCTKDDINNARLIKGTNGDFFSPFLKKSDTLWLYVEDLCRSVSFKYFSDITVKNVPAYRFIINDSGFNYTLPDNCGYCYPLDGNYYSYKKGDQCLPIGLSDISRCTDQNPPLVLSNPHFYGSEEDVFRLFPRFTPTEVVDQTILDIEPTTGTVLSASQKIQISVMMKQYTNISVFKLMKSGAYPICYVNETFLADDNTISQINDQLLDPKNLVKILSFSIGVGLGALLMVLSIVSCMVLKCYKNLDKKKEM
ncbi:CD36 antigen family-containing protein [Strongyloides ratti]|uniref:CD36 antigen family-containing protein n=1 Tax=Strongyloides ratti TaxID=34506 RepID=A0A090L2X6_STRRB|nr:CD36 antigen family-containing protein [Strongyloides ratti]CEF61819.1 CD36 antigen family-containing protein [Strongyloides ratti]